ncbi:alkaline phosphatase family protein [Catalinimonas niigatensis]|uniref:alkaline phosphatase family protein n=1 Tax=Catalinimonas niigatensis TaxID=1397264 RepID=UPI002664FEC8|nr:alkaline phosphatase family protein [Catalinimonas niigatensis]WPP50840.1 alkaline phosphatase family protein [Catalinimonas niigatensis]
MSLHSACDSGEENPALDVKHVIVIGVDGMSPNGIMNASTPVMDDMMQNGSYTLHARGVLPTSSSSNWASMVSGAGPEQHGVTSNGWERDDYILPPVVTGTEEIFPTIFGVARQQRPDLEIGAIYHWSGFGRLIEKSALDYDVTDGSEHAISQKAVAYINNKKPDFLFVHLDHVDHAGHHDGHKTEPYYHSVSVADSLIGNIIQATKDAGIFEESVFIVSSDHGGIGYGHGGETTDEIEIPFIIYGKGVKKNHLIAEKIYTYDNAATVAFLLGLKQPYAWIGKPVKSGFEGFDVPEIGNQKVLIASPIIYPKAHLYEPAGGFFLDEAHEVNMESVSDGAEIRYTLDGSEPDRNSTLYKAPFPLHKSAVVKAKAFLGENEESNTSEAFFRLVKSNADNGIKYSYYEGENWKFLPVFATLKPKKSGRKYQFRVDDINEKKDQFAIRFTSFLKIDTAGEYRFYTSSDDGSKLFIEGEEIVNNDGGHGVIERMGSVELTAGFYEINVEYFNEGGGGWLDVYYKGPGITKQIIPANKLYFNKQ